MDEKKLKQTVSNLMKGVVAKGMLIKRGGGEHNSHRWVKTRKVGSSVVKMAGVGEPKMQGTEPIQKAMIIHELLLKDAGMTGGGDAATVASTGFTPTFGGQKPKKRYHPLPEQEGEDANQWHHGERPPNYDEDDWRKPR